jgi:hypothetical protein
LIAKGPRANGARPVFAPGIVTFTVAIPTEAVVGVVGAGVGGGVTYFTYLQGARKERVSAVRDVLIKLLEVRERAAELEREPGNGAALELLAQKQALYLANALSGAARVRRSLSIDDVLTLGMECAYCTKYTSARHYVETARRRVTAEADRVPAPASRVQQLLAGAISVLGRSKHAVDEADPASRAIVLRGVADYYMGPGPDHDFAQGDELYRQAVMATEVSAGVGPPDQFLLSQTAYTYESWARQYASVPRPYQDKLDSAKRCYARIKDSYGQRALEDLEQREHAGYFAQLAGVDTTASIAQIPPAPGSRLPSPPG